MRCHRLLPRRPVAFVLILESRTRFLDRMHCRVEDLFVWDNDGLKEHDVEIYVERVTKAPG